MHTKFWLEMRSKLAKWSHVTLVTMIFIHALIENHRKIGFSSERRPMLPEEVFLLVQGAPQAPCISLSCPQEIYSRPRAHGTRLPLQTMGDVAS